MPAIGPILQISSPEGQKQLALDEQPVTVGRSPENRVVLADTMASRFHCVIQKVPGGIRLRDLNSSNGTRLNGQVVRTAMVTDGDVIQIGKTQLTVLSPAASGNGAPRGPWANRPPATDTGPIPLAGGEPDVDDSELEEIEELTEADMVEVPPDIDPYSADLLESLEVAPEPEDLGPILMDGGVGLSAGDQTEIATDPERVLYELAESLPNKPFAEGEIALISAGGKTIHAAGAARRGEGGEAVGVFRLLLLVCFRSRASDIHLEPKEDHWVVRIRMGGTMVDALKLNKELGMRVSALVKVLGDIDLTTKNQIQEGRFSARVPGRRVDYRVSFAPSVFGQKLVLRILDIANAPLQLRDLQVPPEMIEDIKFSIQQDAGMVMVCGPTGSGKTTTLYALMRSIDVRERNVITIEDPVEIQIEGITQLPVDESQGKSFSELLRSVLRQDPDVILVGEIRDPETAKTAMQAAITGHIVFSTIHTKDAVGTVFRLLDLGVEPYMLSQGLQAIIAQRLIRQLCPYCKAPAKPTPPQLAKFQSLGAKPPQRLFVPRGCPRCLLTGYAGQRAMFELLMTSDELRSVIARQPNLAEVQKALEHTNFIKLAQSGYRLVAEGAVAFDEVERAVGR